jgi:hypothetical protein
VLSVRASGYGDVAVNPYLNKKHALAAEGTYFSTVPTPGTVTTLPIVTSYANTAGCFFFQNLNPTGGPVAYLDYMKLVCTTVPGSTTQVRYAIIRDLATNLSITTNRTTAATPANVNGASSVKSNCNVLYQNSGTTASVNAAPSGVSAIIATGGLGGLPIIGDELVIDFGGDPAIAYGASSTASRKVSAAPEIAVAPGQQIMIVPWFVGNGTTSGIFDFEFTHIER